MINSKFNNSALGNSGTGLPTHQKQPSIAMKKIALRDVQNDNRSFLRNYTESSFPLEGGPVADFIKVSGNKRLTPECPPSPPYHQPLPIDSANEHLMSAAKKSDSELGKRRIQGPTDNSTGYLQSRQHFQKLSEIPQKQTQNQEHITSSIPASAPIPMTSRITCSPGGPSAPILLGMPVTGLSAADSTHLQLTSEVPHAFDSKGTDDQQRMERFLQLQKFLKHCTESDRKDYVQMLLSLSTPELSRHAIELEKRSILLSVEEGKEIQRMQALNILGRSMLTNNPLATSQQVQSKK